MTDVPAGWNDEAVRLRLLYADEDEHIRDLLRYVVTQQQDVAVATTAPETADQFLDANDVDCVVLTPDQRALVERLRDEAVPYLVFTDADPGSIDASIRASATGIIEKGGESNCAFLVEKARSAAGVGRESGSSWQREQRTSVGDPADLLVAFIDDGRVLATNRLPEAVVDGLAGDADEGLHDRLERTIVNGAEYRTRLEAGALDGYVCDVADADQYLICWRESLPSAMEYTAVEWYRDVTAEVERMDRLRRSQALVENARDGIYALDADGRVEYCNDAFPELFGLDRNDIVGEDATRMVVEEHLQRGQEAIQKLITNPDLRTKLVEMDFRTADDDRITLAINFTLKPFDEDGNYTGLMGVARDVTERKKREQRLAEYRRLVEASNDPMYVLDESGRIDLTNDSLAALVDSDPADLRGRHVDDVLGEQWATTDAPEDSPVDVRLDDSDGKRIFEMRVGPLTSDGQRVGTVHTVREVTAQHERQAEIRRRQEQLRRQNEFLERFSSMVSHDLRNPLGLAQTYAEFAADSGDEDDYEAVEEALDRMNVMIDNLLTFAQMGGSIAETETITVGNLATDAWGSIETDDATLDVLDSRPTECDHRSLLHVFENLFRNAVEHNDGPITIRVDTFAGGFFIADDGRGIPSDEREAIFEHGYTTADSGTGIGLAIVRDVVEAHGWEIHVTDSETGGARFEIHLD